MSHWARRWVRSEHQYPDQYAHEPLGTPSNAWNLGPGSSVLGCICSTRDGVSVSHVWYLDPVSVGMLTASPTRSWVMLSGCQQILIQCEYSCYSVFDDHQEGDNGREGSAFPLRLWPKMSPKLAPCIVRTGIL